MDWGKHQTTWGIKVFNYKELETANLEFIELASLDELPDGERLYVEIDGAPIVVFNIAGDFYAIADLCSHDGGPVGDGELTGFSISCPRHGADFDVRTGEVLSLPAIVDIPAYPIRIENGMIKIGVPKAE